MTAVFFGHLKGKRHMLQTGARLPLRPASRRRPLGGVGGSSTRNHFQDAIDGIAAGQGDQDEDAVGAVFADGFDEEADGAEEREGGGPGIAPGAIGSGHFGIAEAKKKHRDEGEQVVGDEEEGEHGDDALEAENGEGHADEGAEEKAEGGRATLVDARDAAEEEAVAAHGVDDARAHKVQRVDGAEQGKHHDGPEDSVAIRPEDALGGEPEREIVAGNITHRENVKDSRVDKEINEDNGKKTGKDGARHKVAGVLDFVAEVDDAVPAVVSVDGGLNAEKESGDEGGAGGDDDRQRHFGQAGQLRQRDARGYRKRSRQ